MSAPTTAAQDRVITAALRLFARHGAGGTSLQMIADEIGVTKAAVYHQYKTKDEIALAAAETELARVKAVVESAEGDPEPRRALLDGMIDLAIASRHNVGTILNDPVIVGFFADHEMFRDVMVRLRHVLMGNDAGPEARIRTAMLIAAISGAVLHPFVADLSDDVLRAELLRLAYRVLD